MPFNKANPADSEKIRRLGIVIRPNWEAIEEGSQDDPNPTKLKYWALNLFSRDDIPAVPGNDAPDVEDGIAIFAKTDADTGQPEIFTTHEDATVTQLTKGPANIAPVGFANNGETSIYGGVLVKYGRSAAIIPSIGGTVATQDFSSISIGLSDFPNAIFSVILTPMTSQATFQPSYHTDNLDLTGFDIVVTGAATVANTAQYNWIAIGN